MNSNPKHRKTKRIVTIYEVLQKRQVNNLNKINLYSLVLIKGVIEEVGEEK